MSKRRGKCTSVTGFKMVSRAILALKIFLTHKAMLMQLDNTSAVSYINWQGRTKSSSLLMNRGSQVASMGRIWLWGLLIQQDHTMQQTGWAKKQFILEYGSWVRARLRHRSNLQSLGWLPRDWSLCFEKTKQNSVFYPPFWEQVMFPIHTFPVSQITPQLRKCPLHNYTYYICSFLELKHSLWF